MVGLLADIEPEVMDEHIALYGVRTDPSCLTALPERWKTRTVCTAAVQSDGIMLHDVPEYLRTKRMCKAAVWSSIHALPYVPEALHTPDLYREAMVNDPAAIQYFKPELLTREMCHEALYSSYDLRVLRYIPYKEIHEQLLERCEGYSRTKHFLDSMNPDYMTPKLAEMIFTKEPELFYNIPEKFKDKELCETAVRYDGSYLKMVPEALKTPELCMEAIRRSPYAIEFIPETMKSPDLYMNLVKENPQNLYGIPEDDRTYEMCKEAFDNTYGKDKTDYSVAGALTEPSMALQMVREQDDPKTIDFLITVMRPKAISDEVALDARVKTGISCASCRKRSSRSRWARPPSGIIRRRFNGFLTTYARRICACMPLRAIPNWIFTLRIGSGAKTMFMYSPERWTSCSASRFPTTTANGSTRAKRSVYGTWKRIPKSSRIARFATIVRMNR